MPSTGSAPAPEKKLPGGHARLIIANLIPSFFMLLTVALVFGTAGLFLYGFFTNNQVVMYGTAFFAPVIFLVNRPDIVFMLIIMLYSSYITLPGLPLNMNGFYLMAAAFSALMFANKIILKDRRPLATPHILAIAFAAVLLVTANARGFGLRAFGSSTWGGAPYIQLLIATGLLVFSREITLAPRQWRIALYMMCLLSILPPLSHALYALSGGKLYHHFNFIVPDMGAVTYLRGLQHEAEIARLQVANVTSMFYFILAMFLLRNKGASRLLAAPLVLLSIYLMGISGHRIAIVFNLGVALFYLLLQVDKPLLYRVVNRFTMGCLMAVTMLALVADKLPQTYQRALAWLPFARVSAVARIDASNTAQWRLDVWAEMLKEIPDYLLLGKGFAFSASDIMIIANTPMNSLEYVLASRNYHNGVLGTLLDLGVAGLVIALAFVYTAFRTHHGRLRHPWKSPAIRHFHHVALACFLTQFFIHYVLAGGAQTLVSLYLWFVILEGLYWTDVSLKTPRAVKSVEPALSAGGDLRAARAAYGPARV